MEWTGLSPVALRQAMREGKWTGPTGALAPGFEQGNLVLLPEAMADDFRLYCQRNPKPCPLMAEGRPGDPTLPALGAGIDLRTDLPRYRVFRAGEPPVDVTDISDVWRGDLVPFVLGCSLSFEAALVQAGVRLRHYELGTTCTAYMSNLETAPAGPFATKLIVTMRAIRRDQSERVIGVTRRFSESHGEPVHIGDPAAIGIQDISRPDFGDAVDIYPGEEPVFWACGVTPQAVALNCKPSLMMTHTPGMMFITSQRDADYAVL
ncbi:MAG: putative hydro-lyase [Chloroflexi bacterium]|nr:putative hydro-lyase [Chloroflexota bacterium]